MLYCFIDGMLEQFFGSKTRMELLNFYFSNINKSFYVRELVKLTGMQLNSIRRELDNLVKFGILMEDKEYKPVSNSFTNEQCNLPIKRKYYKLNNNFVLYKEIETLMLKSKLLLENNLIKKLKELGKIKSLILTGIFIGVKDSSIDILIIGEVDKNKLKELIHKFGTYVNKDLNYSVLSEEEYKYRLNIKDRFLFDILEKEKIEIK
ncbi:MAG: hypothetical protein V1655_00395 [bacterium]